MVVAACSGNAAVTTTAAPVTTTTTTVATTTTTTTTSTTTTTTTTPPRPVEACRLSEQAYSGVGLGFPRSADRLRAEGTVRITALFADFPDRSSVYTPDDVLAIISPAVEDWFATVSYGHLTVEVVPHLAWLRMGNPSTHYADAIRTFDGHRDWIQEAVDLADPAVDFATTDLVLVVAAPDAAAIPYGPTFVGFAGPGGGITADGVTITNGITSGADLLYWEGLWLPHEMGHSLSLADLYAYGGPTGFTRPFSLMDDIGSTAPEYLAYERWLLGWVGDEQIACLEDGSAEVDLTAIETADGTKAVIVPRSTTRAIVVESRRALGYDHRLEHVGVIVYTVDTTIFSGAGPIEVLNDRTPLAPGESITVEGVTVAVADAEGTVDTVVITVD